MSPKLIYLDTGTEDMFELNQKQHSRKISSPWLKHGGVIIRNLTSSQHRSYHDVFSLRVLSKLESQSPTGLLQHDNDPKVPVNPLTADWNLRNRGSWDHHQSIKTQILIPLSWWGCWKQTVHARNPLTSHCWNRAERILHWGEHSDNGRKSISLQLEWFCGYN